MVNMRNKRGDYKYGIILSLILGLLILSLSLYFIFNEYSTNQDIDQEICRQSIQLRSLLPEASYAGIDWKSFKDYYPLKCKTMVKTIDEDDVKNNKVKKIIAESIVECWALYNKGESSAFPSNAYGVTSTCVPCARIHLTKKAQKYMVDKSVKISIRNSLDLEMRDGYSYYDYLYNSGKKFPAFNPSGVQEFNLDKDVVFRVSNEGSVKIRGFFQDVKIHRVSLPEYFYPNRGDLLINYGIITTSSGENDYNPYLFYFQTEQKPNPFKVVNSKFYTWGDATRIVDILGGYIQYVNFCESWEGIPA